MITEVGCAEILVGRSLLDRGASGTEPKLKMYISVSAENKEAAEVVEAEICESAEKSFILCTGGQSPEQVI